jgi:hypothetical protein
MINYKIPWSFRAPSCSIIVLPSNLKPSFSSLVFLMMLFSSAKKGFFSLLFGLGCSRTMKYDKKQ